MFFFLILSLLLVSGSFGSSSPDQPLLFTNSVFDRLDLQEIRSLLPKNESENLLISYFESEALFVAGKIHESQAKRKKVLEKCKAREGGVAEAKKDAVCLMTTLGFYQSVESKSIFHQTHQIKKWLQSLKNPNLSFEDRAYIEMRTLWKLPDWLGVESSKKSFTKSLLACESLIRLYPQQSSLLFFKSRIFASLGKKQKAKDVVEQALQLNPSNSRALLFLRSGIPDSSFFFGVLANPAGGLGLFLGRRNDRFLDTNRSLRIALSAQSRSVFQAILSYSDHELFSKANLLGSGLVAHEIDQYFGLGSEALLDQKTEIRQFRSEGGLGVRIPFGTYYTLLKGDWFFREPQSFLSDPYLKERQLSFIPSLEVGWTHSNQLGVKGKVFAGHTSFLSTHSFWGYQLVLEKSWDLSDDWEIHLRSKVRGVSLNSPFGVLSDLGGNLALAGVRVGRFRDLVAGYVSPSFSFRLAERWRMGSFGNLAWLGRDLPETVRGKNLAGGGVYLNYGEKPFHSQLEIGYFANEVTIQAGSRWVF